VLDFLRSPANDEIKRRHGMAPVRQTPSSPTPPPAGERAIMIIDVHGHYTTAPPALRPARAPDRPSAIAERAVAVRS
jgi:hypothetical protein